MSKLFNDTMQGLLEAVVIDRGEMPLVEREDMPAKTMFSAELKEKELINQLCEIRKQKKITQEQLAEMTGNKQQAISSAENNMHSPSLRLFCNMVNALGYEIEVVARHPNTEVAKIPDLMQFVQNAEIKKV